MDNQELQEIVEQAISGNRVALEKVIHEIQNKVFGLAMRMLWNPHDAEDATQEILIRVLTRLSDFQGKSQFTTWVYRIATNYLLNDRKKSKIEYLNFEVFVADLKTGMDNGSKYTDSGEYALIVEEAKIGCSQAMLQCLDRDQRMVYILGEIFEMKGPEGAQILDVAPEVFRKRLSRARGKIQNFMGQNCGIVNPDAPCRCAKQVEHNLKMKRIELDKPHFAHHNKTPEQQELMDQIDGLQKMDRPKALFQSHPDYKLDHSFSDALLKVV